MRHKKNTIINLFLTLTTCLFILASNVSAAEFQVGAAGVSVGDSLKWDGTNTVMPVAALQFPLTEGAIKIEIGGFKYTLDKTGKGAGTASNRILYKGELDITGFSAAVIMVCSDPEKDVRFNIGGGFVAHKYKSSLSETARKELALNGISDGKEDIASTIGLQLIIGADFFLTDNLILGFSVRKVDMRPKASFSAVYPTGSAVTDEKIDLSHEMVVLNLLYLFDF